MKNLQGIFSDYLVIAKLTLPDIKNVQECIYWWKNGAIVGEDVLEAFENYLEGMLTKNFDSC